tara:strand:- start:1212 stop:1586 length:375 start_codon:yes stop_codon:yes gene_type:complete
MSKKKEWKGTKQTPKTPEQHKRAREYEEMSPEEKKAVHREQFKSWLKMFQESGPIMYINGKPQEHQPMSKEEADLHMALFDGEVESTPEVKLELAQLEAMRWPKSKKIQGKLWKAMAEVAGSEE